MSNIRLPLLLASLIWLGGCAVFSVDRHEYYRDGEGVFNAQLLEQIKPNTTTYHWLIGNFGEPLFAEAGPAGSHVMTWQFIRQQRKTTRVFGVYRHREAHEERRYLHVVLQDEIVRKVWRDGFATVDAPRVFRAMNFDPAWLAPKHASLPEREVRPSAFKEEPPLPPAPSLEAPAVNDPAAPAEPPPASTGEKPTS